VLTLRGKAKSSSVSLLGGKLAKGEEQIEGHYSLSKESVGMEIRGGNRRYSVFSQKGIRTPR